MNHEFIARKGELKQLSANFVLQTNTVILAPQGWGKTSLVRKAAQDAAFKEKKFRLCHVDLYNVREEERFFELLSESVLKSISENVEDVVRNASWLFKGISPLISFSSPSKDGLRLNFDWNELRKNRDLVADLPYKAAKEFGLKLTICLDDFHSVGYFPGAEQFVTFLTEKWLRHDGVSYCICAPEVHIIEKVAKTPPFSRYGEVIRLGKIDPLAFAAQLKETFADSGKYLDIDNARLIISLASDHPFYIHKLASAAMMGTSVVCSKEVVEKAHADMVDHMHLTFSLMTSSFTSQQLCYLHAVLAGETVISTSEVLHRHHISSATSASRSKTALLEKEIISINSGRAVMVDPLYAFWLRNIYFENK